jgi:hypothetical protein
MQILQAISICTIIFGAKLVGRTWPVDITSEHNLLYSKF